LRYALYGKVKEKTRCGFMRSAFRWTAIRLRGAFGFQRVNSLALLSIGETRVVLNGLVRLGKHEFPSIRGGAFRSIATLRWRHQLALGSRLLGN
jgi:hypothetical protein